MFKQLCLSWVLIAVPASAGPTTLTMEDLKALERNGGFQELLLRARDIPPSQRDAAWKDLVANAATRHLPTLSNEGDPMRKTSLAVEWQREYPSLLESKPWLQTVRSLAPKELSDCFEQSFQGQRCTDTYAALVEGTKDSGLAYAGGEVTTRKQAPHFGVTLYARGFELSPEPSRCGEAALRRSTLAALHLPPEAPQARSAIILARTHCWGALKEDVTSGLAGATAYFARNACPLALEKKAVKGLVARRCAALE
jgi:hypothetical protein